ncbi:DUF6510 family protein [Microbacterium yannicii]|jgi:hypothetical protein|uniref:DUF6510 family protein n=1 Tax=Microbacterium yannicii TaxID=671622 RepID=UPI0002EC597F|nr:DUF6510 family protein [Microbacterium yannicii]
MRADNAGDVVDGNAVAGLLAEVFEADATSLVGVCGGCQAAAPLAETVVEIDEVAAIMRCRTCTHTLLTILRAPAGTRVVVGTLRELRAQ